MVTDHPEGRLSEQSLVEPIASAQRPHHHPTLLHRGGGLFASIGLTLLSVSTPALATDYRWWTTGESAQFGLPDTDDRAFRLDCEPSGGFSVMAPTGADVPEGGKVRVILQGKAGRRTADGVLIELGDGPNFQVKIKPDDDIVRTLMAGGDVTIGSAGDEWSVPGKGAAKALKPVLATCAERRR